MACFIILLVVVITAGVARAEEPTVQSVTVSVDSSDVPLPPRVKKRMELSVTTVGDQVLVGRKTAEVAANQNSYEKLIKEVFDRVLAGYSVQRVAVSVGPNTHIAVLLSPWGEVVRNVSLEVDYGGVSPEAAGLIKQDMGNIEDKIANLLVGMPVDSLDWAGGISKSVIREMLANQLPEFRVNVEVVSGQSAVVRLSLMPVGPLIRDVRVTLRSGSIPNFLLLSSYLPLKEETGKIRGLPVAFVERHSRYFDEALLAAAAKRPVVKDYGLKLSSQMNLGADTEVVVNVETERYKITLEGYLDLGRREDNASAKLHVGRYIDKRNEVFLETTFIPSTVTWDFTPGVGRRFGDQTELGIKYQMNDEQTIFWMNQELGNRWSLRLERTPKTGLSEVGIRYRLHDFLTAEYIFTNNDRWLRLVGNL